MSLPPYLPTNHSVEGVQVPTYQGTDSRVLMGCNSRRGVRPLLYEDRTTLLDYFICLTEDEEQFTKGWKDIVPQENKK